MVNLYTSAAVLTGNEINQLSAAVILLRVLVLALGFLVIGLHIRTVNKISKVFNEIDLEGGLQVPKEKPPQQGPLQQGLPDPRFPASRTLDSTSRSKIWKTRTERDRSARSKVGLGARKHKYVSSSIFPDELVFISESEDSIRVKKFIMAGREVVKKGVPPKGEDGINSCGNNEVEKKTDKGDQSVSEYLTSNESESELYNYPNGAGTVTFDPSNTTDKLQRNRKSISENNLLIRNNTSRGAGQFPKQLVTRSRDQNQGDQDNCLTV
ncbi:uncharacterized protein LOC134825729 [Bolinopsis microptera]|uniref:uncharacterized protein LOC134825729 n=1 Tax=Bolinopsis microptera TaxID=2820187 RepID=UPI0030797FE8